MHARIAAAALPLFAAVALVACGGDAGRETTIHFLAFEEPTITVSAGTTVVWTNRDDLPHTVTAEDDSTDSGFMLLDDTYSMTFNAPGTFSYYCTVHPFMRATVTIQ